MVSTDDFISTYDASTQKIIKKLRKIILSQLPVEKVYLGWQGLGYHHPQAGFVVGIFMFQRVVKVGFQHGNLLEDPDGLLVSGGKRVRYAEYRTTTGIAQKRLKKLISAAIDINLKRKAKRR